MSNDARRTCAALDPTDADAVSEGLTSVVEHGAVGPPTVAPVRTGAAR